MIQNENQLRVTEERLCEFKNALDEVKKKDEEYQIWKKLSLDSITSKIQDFEKEIKQYKESKIPRRSCVWLWSPAEKVIHDAMQAVEEMGADAKLTDAVILLVQAQSKVADFLDENEKKVFTR